MNHGCTISAIGPASRRLRAGRVSMAGQVYLLSFVTRGRAPWFRDFRSARLMVRSLMAERGAMTLCFVVMPDHVHWLMQLLQGETLGGVMQATKSRSARLINAHLGRAGPFWQAGYHDHAVRAEEKLRVVARYVVANPLRVGMVRSVGEYSHWDAVWV